MGLPACAEEQLHCSSPPSQPTATSSPPTHRLQLCFQPGSCDVLASGGYDQAVKVWDCRSRSIDAVQVLKSFRDSVTSVVITER